MKANRATSRIGFLMMSIAMMFKHPVENAQDIKKTSRELHYATGGWNAEFHPKKTKFKGYMRDKSWIKRHKN